MDEVKAQIQDLTNLMLDRFEQIDKRFEAVDQRFTELRTELKEDITNVETNLRGEISAVERNLRDEMTALEHRTNVRFDDLAAGQAQLAAGQAKFEANQADFKAQLTRLEERLFHEEGIRETQAEAIFDTSSQQYRQLDKRLRVVERQLKIKAA